MIAAYQCPSDGRLDTPQTNPAGYRVALTSYLGVSGGAWRWQKGVLVFDERVRSVDINDGTSQTIAVGERPPPNTWDAGGWYTNSEAGFGPDLANALVTIPTPSHDGTGCVGLETPEGTLFVYGPGRLDNSCDRHHFWSLHFGGGNWLFADGSCRFLTYAARPIMPALASRSGGEVVSIPD